MGKVLRKSRRKWFKGGLSDVTAVEERRGRRGGGKGGKGVGGWATVKAILGQNTNKVVQ